MGQIWDGKLKCPYCGKMTEYLYYPGGDKLEGNCDHCGKRYKMIEIIEAKRIRNCNKTGR